MSSDLADAVEWFADAIRESGATCAVDPADADLPGCVVYPSLIEWDRLDGKTMTLTVDVLLIAGGVRQLDAIDQLDTLMGQVRSVFPVVDFTAISAAIPSKSNDPLPAMRATLMAAFEITEA